MLCESKGIHMLFLPAWGSKKKWKVENQYESEMSSDVHLIKVMLVCWNLLCAEDFLKHVSAWKIIPGSVSRVINQECSKPVIKKKRKLLYEVVHQFLQLLLHNILQFLFSSSLCFHLFFFLFSIGSQWKRFCLDMMVSIAIFSDLITVTIWIRNNFGVTLSNFYHFV